MNAHRFRSYETESLYVITKGKTTFLYLSTLSVEFLISGYYMYIHQNLLSRGESQSVGTDERNCFIYLCQNVILSYFSCYVAGGRRSWKPPCISVVQVLTSVKHIKLGECPVAFDRQREENGVLQRKQAS